MRRALVVFCGISLLACGGAQARQTPPDVAQARAATVPSAPDAGARPPSDGQPLFDSLVSMVRRYHVFAPATAKNLGKTWEDYLPRLRAEFAAAHDPKALTVALWHFGNSLHDVHCQFRPKERGPRLQLGFRVGVERKGDGFEFYVERVNDDALKKHISPGDVIVRVDGRGAHELLEHHELDSNMNAKENVVLDVARFLTSRRAAFTHVQVGDSSSWEVRPRAGGEPKTFSVAWRKASNDDDGGDFALDYATNECVNADAKDYGPYKMTARGYRTCIYTSTAPKYRDYPIVRHVSFRYDEIPHGPLADYDLIRSTLARSKPRGVVLDVQDNGGGINPNLFLEWWTDKPYVDTVTKMVLDDTLLKDEHGDAHISSINDAVRDWYTGELARRTPGQKISGPRPFMCKSDTCAWDNRYTPKHRVTAAPVALLLGPGCGSSCDALAWHFDKDNIGPIVGRRPMAGFTTHRARFDVGQSEGKGPLGTIDFAVSYDTPSDSTESIEGASVTIDVPVPRTFDNRERYDALLVDRAIEALGANGQR